MNSYKKLQKYYERIKSDLEEELGQKIQEGTVNVGSEEWRKLCLEIEECDIFASRYATAYDENN